MSEKSPKQKQFTKRYRNKTVVHVFWNCPFFFCFVFFCCQDNSVSKGWGCYCARRGMQRSCYAGVSSDRTNLSPFTKDYRGLALPCELRVFVARKGVISKVEFCSCDGFFSFFRFFLFPLCPGHTQIRAEGLFARQPSVIRSYHGESTASHQNCEVKRR